MPDSNTIYMNYQAAMNQARVLRDEAARLRSLANNDLDSVVRNLRSNWSGSAAEAYCQKCGILKDDMLESAKKLDNLAAGIETAAADAKKADEAAAAIAASAIAGVQQVLKKLKNKQ